MKVERYFTTIIKELCFAKKELKSSAFFMKSVTYSFPWKRGGMSSKAFLTIRTFDPFSMRKGSYNRHLLHKSYGFFVLKLVALLVYLLYLMSYRIYWLVKFCFIFVVQLSFVQFRLVSSTFVVTVQAKKQLTIPIIFSQRSINQNYL